MAVAVIVAAEMAMPAVVLSVADMTIVPAVEFEALLGRPLVFAGVRLLMMVGRLCQILEHPAM